MEHHGVIEIAGKRMVSGKEPDAAGDGARYNVRSASVLLDKRALRRRRGAAPVG